MSKVKDQYRIAEIRKYKESNPSITLKEIAKKLNINERTIYRLFDKYEINSKNFKDVNLSNTIDIMDLLTNQERIIVMDGYCKFCGSPKTEYCNCKQF